MAPAGRPSLATFSQLPDDLCLAILGRLSFLERHACAPSVCKRWRRLCSSPQLLADVEMSLAGPRWFERTRDFCRWLALQQHPRQQEQEEQQRQEEEEEQQQQQQQQQQWHSQQHQQQLPDQEQDYLEDGHHHQQEQDPQEVPQIQPPPPPRPRRRQQQQQQQQQLLAMEEPTGAGLTRRIALKVYNPYGATPALTAQLLGALLAACTAAGPALRTLRFDPESGAILLGSSAAASLAGLERLRLDVVVGELSLEADLTPLTALQELWLDAQPLRLLPSARLPRGVTCLRLGGEESEEMPVQLASLSCLRRLTLRGAEYAPGLGYSLLRHLTTLQQLVLLHCTRLPAPHCLAPLRPSLRSLLLTATPVGDEDGEWAGGHALAPVLQQLTGLTQLVVRDMQPTDVLSPALSCLHSLQLLCWDVQQPAGAAWRLPMGPWLGSLRQAALPAPTAADSLAALSSAVHLECLGLRLFSTLAEERQRDVLRWVATHASLTRVCLGLQPRCQLGGAQAFEALLRAQLSKPALRIEPGAAVFNELSAFG